MRWLALLALAGCTDPPEAALEGRIDAWTARFGIDRSALLVQRCGEPWLEIRRSSPPGERYAVASASKWVSAGVFLGLHASGRIDLDQSLSTWLPELRSPRREATVRQVLNHTAGFPSHHACVADPRLSTVECALAIDEAPGGRPGQVFRYGNAGWTVAAAAVERATGEPFERALDELISEPLGWEGVGYGGGRNPGVAGDLRISAEATVDWLQLLLDEGERDGVRILPGSAVEAMWEGPVVPRAGFVPPELVFQPSPVYGIGAWLDERGPDGRIPVASSVGKFGFQPWIDWDRQLVGVLAVELHGDTLREARPQPEGVRAHVAALADALPPCSATGPDAPVPG